LALGQIRTWQDRSLPAAQQLKRPALHLLFKNLSTLSYFVQECPVAMRYLCFLRPLAWDVFPGRELLTNWGAPTMPYAPFVAACLVKLEQGLACMSQRVNSQAVELGIEPPKLRNGLSIANNNTLIYVLINLHALKRIRQRLAKRSMTGSEPERA